MDGGLSKIVTTIITVFAVTFVGLVAQIFYVLWRRRQYDRHPDFPAGAGGSVVVVKAKECVYLFCWRNQTRIEPKEIVSRVDDESDADEVEKWRQLCGPSRVLFTIKEEEEREGVESLASDCCSLMADEPMPMTMKQTSPDPATSIQTVDDPTPFVTPCTSPPYYTPSTSPTREAIVKSNNSTTVPTVDDLPADEASGCKETQFLAIEIRSH